MKLITIAPQTERPAPLERAQASRSDVLAALDNASEKTGVSFDYLLKTATRESSLNPAAKAKTSSATGLFQFIEQTWLATVKKHGAAHGYQAQAAAIEGAPGGRYKIADPATREEILALRKDPEAAAIFAGAFTRDLQHGLREGLGREPTEGELYSAHVMGLGGSLKLIRAAERGRGPSAADLFPEAAAANRSIFYAKSGGERTAEQVLAQLTRHHDRGAMPSLSPQPAADPVPDIAPNLAVAGLRGSLADDAPPAQHFVGRALAETYVLSPVMVQILASLDPATLNRDHPDHESGAGTRTEVRA